MWTCTSVVYQWNSTRSPAQVFHLSVRLGGVGPVVPAGSFWALDANITALTPLALVGCSSTHKVDFKKRNSPQTREKTSLWLISPGHNQYIFMFKIFYLELFNHLQISCGASSPRCDGELPRHWDVWEKWNHTILLNDDTQKLHGGDPVGGVFFFWPNDYRIFPL